MSVLEDADALDRLLWDRWRGKVIRGGALSGRPESLFAPVLTAQNETTTGSEVSARKREDTILGTGDLGTPSVHKKRAPTTKGKTMPRIMIRTREES